MRDEFGIERDRGRKEGVVNLLGPRKRRCGCNVAEGFELKVLGGGLST